MSKRNKAPISHPVNTVPSIVFTPFKKSRITILILMFLSIGLNLYLLVNVMINKLTFSSEQLRDLSGFVLNLVLVIAALGFSIFSLPIKTAQPKKGDLLLSYIGQILCLASITVFSYTISYCPFLISTWDGKMISLYVCICLFLMSGCILKLLSTIVAYFNIRD